VIPGASGGQALATAADRLGICRVCVDAFRLFCPLAEAGAAMETLLSRRHPGKIVLEA